MRCNEAKRRLTQGLEKSPRVEDRELLHHIRQCPACARFAKAAETLQRDFATAQIHDTAEGMPLWMLRSRVEARASFGMRRNNMLGISTFEKLFNNLRERSRVSLGIATAVAVLALVTLVPFKFDRTVGYEVAVAGVDKNLALDDQKVSDLMVALGLDGAKVDVTGCEATCNVVIRQLQTQADADLVAAAFAQSNEDCQVVRANAVMGEASEPIIIYVKRLFKSGDDEGRIQFQSQEEINNVLMERLGEDFDGNVSLWISKTIEDSSCVAYIESGDMVGEGGSVTGQGVEIIEIGMGLPDSNHKCIFVGPTDGGELPDGLPEKLILPNGEIDEAILQQLKEMGLDVKVTKGTDGSTLTVTVEGCAMAPTDGEETDESAEKSSTQENLPEGYVLEQNYPNPFNPTTIINYRLAETERVTLDIINTLGQKVRTLVDDVQSAGEHSVEWDSRSDAGARVSSGVYFYRLTAGEAVAARKMTLLK